MTDIITVKVENPKLSNDANRVFVTIKLQKDWEEIEKQSNIMISMCAYLPVLGNKEVQITMYQAYDVAELLETKQVQMEFEITEAIDESKAAWADASFLSYSKK